MALVLQNSDGTAEGANGYLSVTDFKAYHDNRGQSYGTATDSAIAAAIVAATSYLDSRWIFGGRKYQGRAQTTVFPRIGLMDADRLTVDGIPREIVAATAEYALAALSGPLAPTPVVSDSGFPVSGKTETVGPITESTSYSVPATGKPSRFRPYPLADAIIQASGFLRSVGTDLVRG